MIRFTQKAHVPLCVIPKFTAEDDVMGFAATPSLAVTASMRVALGYPLSELLILLSG
jgi:hypothetical protein